MNNYTEWNERMVIKHNPSDYHHQSNLFLRFITNKRVGCLIKFLDPKRSDKIIDLGCGAGNIIEKIKRVREITGVDLSKFLLDLAENKHYKSSVKFIRANIEHLPKEITDSKFDKVYCSETLEHVENPDKVLQEMKKIIKKNGTIIISIPNERLIKWIKNLLIKLKIFPLFFPGVPEEMSDEYHLNRRLRVNNNQSIIQGEF